VAIFARGVAATDQSSAVIRIRHVMLERGLTG